MSEHPLDPAQARLIDALLAISDPDAPLDEAALDALAEALPAAELPAAWPAVAARLALPAAPPSPGLDWDALAAAWVAQDQVAQDQVAQDQAAQDQVAQDQVATNQLGTDPPATELGAAPTAPPPLIPARRQPDPRQRRPPLARWLAPIGAALVAAAALFALRPAPWTIHPDELREERLAPTARGVATAGPRMQVTAPGPGPLDPGVVRLTLSVRSDRPIDTGSLQLRSLRGSGRLLRPQAAPQWTGGDTVTVELRLPSGQHPIELSVLDDLQREGTLVVELEVR